MNTQKTILWIHGFAGRPDNANVQEMRKLYSDYNWYSIEVDHNAKSSMEKINNYIHTHDVCLVAGTSLGGYYAICAEYSGPKLVVNPVVDPVRNLRQFVGENTYKPGRTDGQLNFTFTEAMLQEFALLQPYSFHNVLCHHTVHDQVLGEAIKDDYKRLFYFIEAIDPEILPSHFMTCHYVKYMNKALNSIINLHALELRNPYDCFGITYQHLPKNIIPTLMISYSRLKSINWKKLLLEVEECIKEMCKNTHRLYLEPYSIDEKRTRETFRILFNNRKSILNHLFTLTQDSFDALKEINNNLEDLYNHLADKMQSLYSAWLDNEEEAWRNYCEVSGQISAESTADCPADDTGSDYAFMMERIEDLEGNIIVDKEFSGAPEKPCDIYKLDLHHDCSDMKYSGGGNAQFGEFLMCHAFQHLLFDSLYSIPDILRIKYFWCDASITHQRIINAKGEVQ